MRAERQGSLAQGVTIPLGIVCGLGGVPEAFGSGISVVSPTQ